MPTNSKSPFKNLDARSKKGFMFIVLLIILCVLVVICCTAKENKFYFNVSGIATTINDQSGIGASANVGYSFNVNNFSIRNTYCTGGPKFYFYEFMAIEHNYEIEISKNLHVASIISFCPFTTLTMMQNVGVTERNSKKGTFSFGFMGKCRISDAYFVTMAIRSHVMGVSSSDRKTGIESNKTTILPVISLGFGK